MSTMTQAKPVTAAKSQINGVYKFFGKLPRKDGSPGTLADFRDEWIALPEPAREQLRAGIEDGTLTY